MRPAKRAFDLFWAGLGLLVLWPVLLAIAALIKLDDGGPVLFRQVRVGRGARTFRIVKFRTMRIDAERRGALLTVGEDRRITRVGRWLRRLKLDELPQLWNVLRGEMSFVGPRPEVPRYTAHFRPDQRAVLELTPGITHPGILWDEDVLLAQAPDAERFYIAELIPEKNRRYLEYAARATLWTDFVTILQTIGRLVPATRHWANGHGGRLAQGGAPRAAAARAMVSTAARTSERAK
jgi:lipopolysaccharide/colanic/teichoic acid biosynthesis glycosyltransferase